MSPARLTNEIASLLRAHANPAQAGPMARYMKDRFAFLGLKRPDFQPLVRPLLKPLSDSVALHLAQRLWRLPEREFQYVAIDALAGRDVALETLRDLITKKSWWDSVDGLTGHVLAPVIARHRDHQITMDQWSRADNFWLRRAAILHQLNYKHSTDTQRLFAYCAANAGDEEFFIRKAIGWALRNYARINAPAVRRWIDAHPELSSLSRREALKHQ